MIIDNIVECAKEKYFFFGKIELLTILDFK
jgi:hypothetical protein